MYNKMWNVLFPGAIGGWKIELYDQPQQKDDQLLVHVVINDHIGTDLQRASYLESGMHLEKRKFVCPLMIFSTISIVIQA